VLNEKRVGLKHASAFLVTFNAVVRPQLLTACWQARLGTKAVQALISEKTDVMTGLNGRAIELIPLEKVIQTNTPPTLNTTPWQGGWRHSVSENRE